MRRATQIKAKRGEEVKTRDAQKWKVVNPVKPRKFYLPQICKTKEDADIGPPRRIAATLPPPPVEAPQHYDVVPPAEAIQPQQGVYTSPVAGRTRAQDAHRNAARLSPQE